MLGRVWVVAMATTTLLACGGAEPKCEEALCAKGVGGSGGYSGGGGAGGTSPSPSIAPPEGPFPPPIEASAACAQPGEVIDVLTNPKDVEIWLTRRWVFCSGTYLFLNPHDGIEFVNDGHWYFLDLIGNELVRRSGFAGGGDWGVASYGYDPQVSIDRFQGGGSGGFMRFAVSPLKVSMSLGVDGSPPEYIATSPAPP